MAGASTTLYAVSESGSTSSTPVTVTLCGTFQLDGVKVRLETETVPSAVLELDTPNVTFADGWLCRTTVNEALAPVSGVTKPLVGVTLMPATSSSALVPATFGG